MPFRSLLRFGSGAEVIVCVINRVHTAGGHNMQKKIKVGSRSRGRPAEEAAMAYGQRADKYGGGRSRFT